MTLAEELSDLAHIVSAMTMQAGAVRLRLKQDQTTEREMLTLIEGAGREAVEEVRRMMTSAQLLEEGQLKSGGPLKP
ncbi:histidine kinase [Nonomuraea sp. NPDC050663]|uniref:histidine kinase n=1 Tax=Nonomuraea sp. NPDC050663 TaxID=3364370 RepID=UPI0017C2CEBB|nr:histidine kinase [Nonomuraea sp.]